ncbi:MAG: hypothetical protein AAGC68_06625 [Verrucomicrobiota bacterium]
MLLCGGEEAEYEEEKLEHFRVSIDVLSFSAMNSVRAEAYARAGRHKVRAIGHPIHYALSMMPSGADALRTGILAFPAAGFYEESSQKDFEVFLEQVREFSRERSSDCVIAIALTDREMRFSELLEDFEQEGGLIEELGAWTDDGFLTRFIRVCRRYRDCFSVRGSELAALGILAGCRWIGGEFGKGVFSVCGGIEEGTDLEEVLAAESGRDSVLTPKGIRELQVLASERWKFYEKRISAFREAKSPPSKPLRWRTFRTGGLDGDGWLENEVSFECRQMRGIEGIELRFELPKWANVEKSRLALRLGSREIMEFEIRPGWFALELPFDPDSTVTKISLRWEVDFQLPHESRRRAARLGEVRHLRSITSPLTLRRVRRLIETDEPEWKKVLVFAGLSGGGKSYFISALGDPEASDFRLQLGLPADVQPWAQVELASMGKLTDPTSPVIAIHYEMNRGMRYLGAPIDFGHDRRLWDKLGGVRDRLTIVTIETPARVLRSRISARGRDRDLKQYLGREDYRGHLKMPEVQKLLEYQISSEEVVDSFQQEWLRFCEEEGFPTPIVIPGYSGRL